MSPLTDFERSQRKEKTQHIQCLPEALQNALVWHFPNHGRDRAQHQTDDDKEILRKAARYFVINKTTTVSNPRYLTDFTNILREQGFRTDERVAGFLRTTVQNFCSSDEKVAPLHVAAIGMAYSRLYHHFASIARSKLRDELRSPYTTPEIRAHLKYTDLKSLEQIISDSFSTVAEIISLLTYDAQSPEEAIAIIEKNLEPFPGKEARGFSGFELLSNTIIAFWGNFMGMHWRPNGVLDSDGRVSGRFIGAVHSLIKKHPEAYHGGCVNRYAVGEHQESAVNESVRIFLEYFKDAVKRLRPNVDEYRKIAESTPSDIIE